MRASTIQEARMLALTSADLFRATWPRHTAKRVAQASQGPVATAKAWVAARFTPSADTLLRMAAENTELRAELIRRLEAYGYADTGMASRVGADIGPAAGANAGMDAAPGVGEAGAAGGPGRPTVTGRVAASGTNGGDR